MGCGYFWSCFYINTVVCLLFFPSSTFAIAGNDTDRLALLEFKAKIDADPSGVLSSWNGSIHFCQWYGVTCSRRHQRVTVLDLNSLKLVGTISPHIGNLSFLKVLDLKNNSFRQYIPPEVGRLRRLHTLYLYNNSLSGEIPSNLSTCSDLTILSLVNNHLVGEIPAELGLLSKLQYLSVSWNNLSGSIPPSLGNLSSLATLSAALNNFVGNVPEAFGRLRDLTFLGLTMNQLSGIIPSSIFNLSSITLLDVGSNQFEGNLPTDLFISLPKLETLSIAYNQINGPIPNSVSSASNLRELQLQGNKLTGKVPSLERLNVLGLYIDHNLLGKGEFDDLGFICSLTNASILDELYISRNNFGGEIPECISNLSSNLAMLSLYENQISGKIPAGIGNLVNLESIEMYKNKLSGIIPQSIGNLQNLVRLILDENKISGPIPSSLGNLTNLNRLHSADNNLQGTIPSSLANCKYLQLLDFSRNNLTGTLPPQVIGHSSLSIYVGFAQNNLSGSLPREVENLKDLGILDVSDNMLSGEIPSSLGSCIRLEYLYMKGNQFQGPIPSSLSSLRGLQVLDLSYNNLSGQIPEFLGGFNLTINLNLSFNNFEGRVPTDGVFKNASITSVMGNTKLCGGIPEFQLPACSFERSDKKRLKVIAATIAGSLGAILVVLSLVFLLRLRKKSHKPASSYSENSLLKLSKVSYRDLHKATDGFSSANLVGTGSFGSVYKGILDEGGPMIAVKVLNLQHHGAAKSFMAECEALRNIRHRNLVKIITACSGVDYQGNDFKALVYEYMDNGNLEKWLHPPVSVDGNHEEPRNLNLLQRVNIAIDVASAIEYLHHHCGNPIVHCDLKPSNVLLNDEMTAHIGDFGLAKFLLENIQNNSTNQFSSIGLRGTIGYAPPEYGLGSEVSTYGDVYSYGVLLLEMFTGKRPTDDIFKEGWNLHKFAESALPNRVDEIVDPILFQGKSHLENPRSGSDNKTMMECFIFMVGIGIACSAELPANRMDISDAAKKLCLIRDKLMAP
ncbi:hypothetical protein P3X46_025792 [Hevea brasiliensis]|uniref:Protein kinase domain-containing protein n=1 Tax=Hevea brasiliensis TaxID=3981 RepID=A0ABQ9L8H8_HEVBR|nr:putative receptor-like protein kinase At3g47110 [Hevea brasiliensis]KAJ9160385.1 hypothetical protein P3X46_025792 [Hevea brasiliensis]